MKKQLLFIVALIMTLSVNAAELNMLDSFGSAGWGSEYDAATKTITYSDAWTGRGWWGPNCVGYTGIKIEFEPLTIGVQIVVEFNTEGVANETAAAAVGATELTHMFAGDVSDIKQIYLQCQGTAGTVVLVSAVLFDGEGGGEPTELDILGTFGGSGWGDSTYDPVTKTITYVTAWTGRGWWEPACAGFKGIRFGFEALTMDVKLVVEYKDKTNEDAMALVGATSLSYTFLGDPSEIQQIYLQNSAVGTVVLTSAVLFTDEDKEPEQPKIVFTFDELEDGDYASTSGGGAAVKVVADPKKDGKALEVTLTNYDSMPTVAVTLPEGVTFANVASISFDVYADASDWKETMINVNGTMIYKPGTYPQALWAGEWKTNTTEAANFNESAADFAALTTFTLGVGLNANALVYYIDNITLTLDVADGIRETIVIPVENLIINFPGGIEVNNNGQPVEVYAIDGSKVAQTTDSRINLEKGIYIVRVANGKAMKTIVR